jgi:hypothetical protein
MLCSHYQPACVFEGWKKYRAFVKETGNQEMEGKKIGQPTGILIDFDGGMEESIKEKRETETILPPPLLPCVIYCHGNSGCRLNCMEAIRYVCPNATLFALDFSGCGLSTGEYVSP